MFTQVHDVATSCCLCACVCPTGGLPSLFDGDTPSVYTAPANAILVVGPCLWVLLGGCAYENRPGTHNPLFRWSCTVLQNVFKWFLHDLNMLCGYVCTFVCVTVCVCLLCFCLCVVCVYICVLKASSMHVHGCDLLITCGGSVRREIGRMHQVEVVSHCW